MIPLVTIEGPTASGKSALALQLVNSLGSGIVSADSRQIYRGMDIGTAKPSRQEQKAVRHHLIDIIDPSQSYDAGSFIRDARSVIAQYRAQGLIPVICGGTGLYIRSLLEGICALPPIAAEYKQRLLARLNQASTPEDRQRLLQEMHNELYRVDPEFAAQVSSRDSQRIIRGLEVFEATGLPLSQHWRLQKGPDTSLRDNSPAESYKAFRILISPPREQLYERINLRMEQMLHDGLLEEIKGLLERGYDWHSPGLNSLGYKEFKPYFENAATLEQAQAMAAQHSRNYAKRQITWYRKVDFDLASATNELSMSVLVSRIEASLLSS